jgi:pyruvate,water dikinase
MLAAGDALGFAERDLAVELTVAELVDALHELPDAPDEPVARARRDARAELSRHVAPRLLGPDEPLPPLAALPHAMAVFTRAFMLFRELNATVEHDDGLDGIGIGDHIATGRAVVADDATDALLRIEPGDILVTRMTTPAFNAALSCAGGLVVVEAGLVSHAAIMARELSLPTVLGVRDAMQIVDGACIHVDPLAGRVHVTDAPATPRG